MRSVIAVLGPVLLLAGCMFGPKAADFGPGGGESVLQTTSGSVRGELLTATDSSLVVFDGQLVTEVRFGSMHSGRINPGGGRIGGTPPDRPMLERLRRLSRFPQGLTPELLSRFMQANHVTRELRKL